jgi:Tol biopolymer transport system component
MNREASFFQQLLVLVMIGIGVSAFSSCTGTISDSGPNLIGEPENITAEKNMSLNHKLSYVREDWVYFADLATGTETRVVEGQTPDLSPDGKLIAYLATNPGESSLEKLFPRQGRLRIFNLQTHRILEFNSLERVRAFNPKWSSDGTRIAFSVADPQRKYVGILTIATGTWKRIDVDVDSDETVYVDSWTPRDREILFHTLTAVYEMRVEESVARRLTEIEPFLKGQISSASRFSWSAEKRYLLFNRTVDTAQGPRFYISAFDAESSKLMPITPDTVDGHSPGWIPGSKEIFFTRQEKHNDAWRSDICAIALNGTNLRKLISDGNYASISR